MSLVSDTAVSIPIQRQERARAMPHLRGNGRREKGEPLQGLTQLVTSPPEHSAAGSPSVVEATSSGHSRTGPLERAEDLVHYSVAFVLMGVAIFTLFDTIRGFAMAVGNSSFAAATNAVNGVLFAVIIVEITRTVLSHFDRKGLQLRPFLIIGIISAVREVLTVGARLSLNEMGTKEIHTSLLELAINAAVVFGLALSLVLIQRFSSLDDDTPAAS